MQRIYQKIVKGFAVISSLLILATAYPVTAASVSPISDTPSRTQTGATTNHTVRFKATTGFSAGTGTVTINFGTSFSNSPAVVVGDIALSHGASTGLETADTVAASAGANQWGFSWASPTLTLTVPTSTYTMAAGNYVVVTINNNRFTNAAAGVYLITVGGSGVFTDSGTAAINIISGSDQIAVNATVNPTITLTIASTTMALGTLTTGAVAVGGPNSINLQSNSAQGYTISIKDLGDGGSNQGLYNSAAAKRIYTSALGAISAGTEGYGGVCDAGTATGTCTAANFNNNASNQVGPFSTAAAGISFASLTAGSKPNVAGDTFNLRVKAAINGQTDAGTYVDTLTVLATMNF